MVWRVRGGGADMLLVTVLSKRLSGKDVPLRRPRRECACHCWWGYAIPGHAAVGGECSAFVVLDDFVLDGQMTSKEARCWHLPREQLWDLFRDGWSANEEEMEHLVQDVYRRWPGFLLEKFRWCGSFQMESTWPWRKQQKDQSLGRGDEQARQHGRQHFIWSRHGGWLHSAQQEKFNMAVRG